MEGSKLSSGLNLMWTRTEQYSDLWEKITRFGVV